MLEAWDCPNCAAENWVMHPFFEIVACGKCGTRKPSAAPYWKNPDWAEPEPGRGTIDEDGEEWKRK